MKEKSRFGRNSCPCPPLPLKEVKFSAVAQVRGDVIWQTEGGEILLLCLYYIKHSINYSCQKQKRTDLSAS